MSGLASPHYRDLWLDCLSYRDIGEQLSIDDKTVAAWCAEKAQDCENSAPESRQHFDIWQFQTARRIAARSPIARRETASSRLTQLDPPFAVLPAPSPSLLKGLPAPLEAPAQHDPGLAVLGSGRQIAPSGVGNGEDLLPERATGLAAAVPGMAGSGR